MQSYDLFMIVVLVAATIRGLWKGLVWQLASLASIVLSYWVAYQFRDQVAQHIGATPPWNVFLSMLILYLGTSLLVWILFRYVRAFIDNLKLESFDRQIGAILGAAKGVVLCVIITLFAVTLSSEPQQRAIIESRSGYYIAHLLNKAHAIMPSEIHDVLHVQLHKLDESLENPPAEHNGHHHVDDGHSAPDHHVDDGHSDPDHHTANSPTDLPF